MNKKGIGMGPAIAISVLLLVFFFLITHFSLSLGKVSIIKTAKASANNIDMNELLLNLLNSKSDKLNLADLLVLGKYDEVGDIIKEKLPSESWSLKVYKKSEEICSLGRKDINQGAEAKYILKNYFGEDLMVNLKVKNE